MKLRLAHRYLWFTICFLYRKIPAWVWVFLAVVQIVTLVAISYGIPDTAAAAATVKAQGGSPQRWDALVIEMQKARIVALISAPIFLILAKLKIGSRTKH